MKATITSGKFAGTEFEVSNETIKNLDRIKSIPVCVQVGQVYKINDTKYLVASVGSGISSTAGLTIVGDYKSKTWDSNGCYDSSVLIGQRNFKNLRICLLQSNATYLGTFNEIFKEVK